MFAHAVWFTPATAQAAAHASSGLSLCVEDSLHDLCNLWEQTDLGESEGQYAAGLQPASGRYLELGNGILSGTGRTSIAVDGMRSCLPYYRNRVESDRFEEPLASVLGPTYAVVRLALPPELVASHDAQYDSFSPDVMRIASAYQYPRPVHECLPMLASHQTAIRGVVTRLGTALDESDESCRNAVSNLHIDRMDGGRAHGIGAVTTYACLRKRAHSETENGCDTAALNARDLAVFPTATGGCGVRIPVMRPGWMCSLVMQTSSCLHGGIAEGCEVRSLSLPHLHSVRIVTYPIHRIDLLLERLSRDEAACLVVREKSTRDTRRRMQ